MRPLKKFFFFAICILSVSCIEVSGQESKEQKPVSIELDYFSGYIVEHNQDIKHLITGFPDGFILSVNRKTYGFNAWERRYNYPDWGFTLTYQDLKNTALGHNIGLYGHFNFYLLNRRLMVRIGQGIAYASNPYDRDTNFQNIAYGSHLQSTTMVKANYNQQNLWRGLGFQIGLSFIHYSNANVKAPNTSTNTLAINVGLNYLIDHENFPDFIPWEEEQKYTEPIHYNFVFRSGVNESDIIGQGRFPFYVFSFFADKRLNHKSTLQAGTELFLSEFLKELIYFRSVSFPEDNLSGDEDYKRVGVFIGHELRFNRVALTTQLGYYVYYPYDFEGRVYTRIGLKRYFDKRDRFFGAVTVKSHGAKAEAVEFGIGIRFN